MNKIAPRQLYFYLACIAPLGKLLLLPTQLVNFARNDLLFPAFINLLIQAGVIFCIMLLSRAETPLFELLENTFGKVISKIFLALFALFFLYAALFPLIEQKLFVQSVFYDTLPSFLTFLPFFIFGAYACAKPFLRLGRVWDILAPVAVTGFVGLMIFAIPNADMGALLPVGASGVKGIVNGTAQSMLWFFDSAIVLLLIGNFRYQKGMALKATAFYLSGGVAVLFFLAVFYGIFSDIAIRQTFAFAKVSKYFSATSVLGRIDYLFIILLALGMAFYALLPVQAGIHCLTRVTDGKVPPLIFSVGANALFAVLLTVLNFQTNQILDWIGGRLFFIFPVFCVGVPLACLPLRRNHERKTA